MSRKELIWFLIVLFIIFLAGYIIRWCAGYDCGLIMLPVTVEQLRECKIE